MFVLKSKRHTVAFYADLDRVASLCHAADVSKATHLFVHTGHAFLDWTPI